MSSAAYLTWDEDTEGVSLDSWTEFCEQNNIEYSPQTIGKNVYYNSEVEFTFGDPRFNVFGPPDYAERITVSTYHMGYAMPDVAYYALKIWRRFGGSLQADYEIRCEIQDPAVLRHDRY